ncbi:MAG: phosphopentomutase [Candidatus Paraimprobicoccus trichonymphae]|uniref:Phosphopentomutase n=1 Tax=Candidatus Paraimprobicoccus trichonymphae TaxID=3033793 RepID=A0AA48I6J0_9FIRM|nr:MAG: phosphopentomutase [Candidatus Paraimprobicoccus trichonymphae]
MIVLDSLGIGEMFDAIDYGDKGSNTLKSCFIQKNFSVPNLQKLGLFNIDGIDYAKKIKNPLATFARLAEKSKGKDSVIGHWEIAGLISKKPMPVFLNGFPKKLVEKFEKIINKKIICNKPYSGTKLLEDYGKESVENNKLILYTSADSVFQLAAHEKVMSLKKLYNYCEKARKLLTNRYAVGRVIARPFIGKYPNYERTANRKDFALEPFGITLLDKLKNNNYEVIAVGKIRDIFSCRGITKSLKTVNNQDGMNKTINIIKNENFEGLCFVNLIDFDTLYGHRNDALGYAKALSKFDVQLGELIKFLKKDDILILTGDHGCDPLNNSTDHSREYVPLLIFGKNIESNVNLGTKESFSFISKFILKIFL